jgi:hypothetical protein
VNPPAIAKHNALEIEVGDKISRSNLGTIAGCVVIRSGNSAFPEPRWSDIPVVLLAAWVTTIAGTWDSVELTFMDGPFSVQLTRSGEDVHPVFLKNGLRVEWMPQDVTISIQRLTTELMRASKVVLDACAERGWDSQAVRDLKFATSLA